MYTGFIYKIVADGTDKVYYGSTINSLNKRMDSHIYYFKTGRKCSSREMFDYPNTQIELLETHYNVDKKELQQILFEVEAGYINRFRKYRPGRCVNEKIPYKSLAEYHQEIKEIKERLRLRQKDLSSNNN
tara:strand:- start:1359 stop:1748 length:390 start_codon:yes stop_codon:yes gene_type:complete